MEVVRTMVNIAVIGSGGREHALVKKLATSKSVKTVFALPGNVGTRPIATNVDVDINDFDSILKICQTYNIEWVIVGPEEPLANGIADFLTEYNIKVFGPKKHEAQMESSKDFTKRMMEKYGIPTAKFETFRDLDEAKTYVHESGTPIVLKQDGLAAGKGVIVALTDEEAVNGLEEMQPSGDKPVVIEEFLLGEEFSLMVLVNGEFFHPFEMIAQDHKRAYDSDTGPNTGGMGAYAPVSHISMTIRQKAIETIVEPITRAMVEEGLNYFGVLYLGAIVDDSGDVRVIEFNARFGDPEAQVLLEMMESDLFEIIEKTARKEPFTITWKPGYTVGVMLASNGYPGDYEKGKVIDYKEVESQCFVSGLTEQNSDNFTSGGRVLLVTGHGDTVEQAREKAYSNIKNIKYNKNDLFYRTDIGIRALGK